MPNPDFCVCNENGPCLAHDPRESCSKCDAARYCDHCGREDDDATCTRHSDATLLMEDAAKLKASKAVAHG